VACGLLRRATVVAPSTTGLIELWMWALYGLVLAASLECFCIWIMGCRSLFPHSASWWACRIEFIPCQSFAAVSVGLERACWRWRLSLVYLACRSIVFVFFVSAYRWSGSFVRLAIVRRTCII